MTTNYSEKAYQKAVRKFDQVFLELVTEVCLVTEDKEEMDRLGGILADYPFPQGA